MRCENVFTNQVEPSFNVLDSPQVPKQSVYEASSSCCQIDCHS